MIRYTSWAKADRPTQWTKAHLCEVEHGYDIGTKTLCGIRVPGIGEVYNYSSYGEVCQRCEDKAPPLREFGEAENPTGQLLTPAQYRKR